MLSWSSEVKSPGVFLFSIFALEKKFELISPSQGQIWQTGTREQQQSQGPKTRYLQNCKSSLVLEHGYTTATVWSARVDRSTVGLDSWSMGLAEVIQVPEAGHRSGMGSWITRWKAVFRAQWARCKSMVGPSPNSGTRGHGTEEKQCSSGNGRSKTWVRALGSGTKRCCSAACGSESWLKTQGRDAEQGNLRPGNGPSESQFETWEMGIEKPLLSYGWWGTVASCYWRREHSSD